MTFTLFYFTRITGGKFGPTFVFLSRIYTQKKKFSGCFGLRTDLTKFFSLGDLPESNPRPPVQKANNL